MSSSAKRQIIEALDLLPDISVEQIKDQVLGLLAKSTNSGYLVDTEGHIKYVPELDPNAVRPFGLAKGDFVTPENFDEPLPSDILDAFEGK
jgi:hypothetical protein